MTAIVAKRMHCDCPGLAAVMLFKRWSAIYD